MFLYTPAQIALGCLVAACRWPGTGADVPAAAALETLKCELQLFVEGGIFVNQDCSGRARR